MILYDEAHHVCTERHLKMLEDLDELNIRRYFFTATPRETKRVSMLISQDEDESEEEEYDSTDEER